VISDQMAANRLPDSGAGFVWEQDGGAPVLRPRAKAVVAAFTTRVGGRSPAPFDTLNLSFVVGDREEHVKANRAIAGAMIGRGRRLSTVKQVHGGTVVRAEAPGRLPEADAQWTDTTQDTIAVLAADCVPLLVAGGGRAAVVHAGWRGLIAGIVEATTRQIAGASVFAGPAIGPCCYEVGPEVAEAFTQRFGPGVVSDHNHVDLWAAAEVSAGQVGASQVASARICTSCHPELFFSHRRDGGRTGRQALVARLIDG
jgi:purine-nucleoside/S-methyl-5'-thioadenosine phosphorylase / adenosine deaminase